MADLTVTAASVGVASSDVTIEVMEAGEAITRGKTVYRDTADSNKAKLADANASSTTATVYGVAVSESAGDGDYILVAKRGTIITGATMTKGQLYYQSATAGGVAPYADLTTGDYVSSIYRATSTTEAVLDIDNSGIQL